MRRRRGNHGWVIQRGTTKTASARSLRIFCRTLLTKLKGGKAYNSEYRLQSSKKQSIATAWGSGCHAQYGFNWWFSLDANKSMESLPHEVQCVRNSLGLSCHSVESLNTLEAVSASTLRTPGQCVADSQTFFCMAQTHMSRAMALQLMD